MKALVGAFNQEKALVQPVVEPMEHYTALAQTLISPPNTSDSIQHPTFPVSPNSVPRPPALTRQGHLIETQQFNTNTQLQTATAAFLSYSELWHLHLFATWNLEPGHGRAVAALWVSGLVWPGH